jgi:dsRNA-specific ribonuclease
MTENPDLEKLQNLIDYHFADIRILEEGLKRRAFLNENPDSSDGGMDPLATLGDAVLGLAIIQHFYEAEERDKGKITEIKSSQVNRKNTRKFAEKHNLMEYILWGKGEELDKIYDKGDKALDTVTEALLGAIYLDAQNRGENGMNIIKKMLVDMDFFDRALISA